MFDFDDTDLAMLAGLSVVVAGFHYLGVGAKDLAMAYLTGVFGIVGLKRKARKGGVGA